MDNASVVAPLSDVGASSTAARNGRCFTSQSWFGFARLCAPANDAGVSMPMAASMCSELDTTVASLTCGIARANAASASVASRAALALDSEIRASAPRPAETTCTLSLCRLVRATTAAAWCSRATRDGSVFASRFTVNNTLDASAALASGTASSVPTNASPALSIARAMFASHVSAKSVVVQCSSALRAATADVSVSAEGKPPRRRRHHQRHRAVGCRTWPAPARPSLHRHGRRSG